MTRQAGRRAKRRPGAKRVPREGGGFHEELCAHDGDRPPKSHDDGIAAHIAIHLQPNVDIWAAYRALKKVGLDLARTEPKFHIEKLHVSFGEIDMLADVHAAWTTPRGRETRIIAEYVNRIRTAKADRKACVQRTQTMVCVPTDF